MKKEIKIWHISDTHGLHRSLKVPDNIDIVIVSGDISNNKNQFLNEPEVLDFLEWFIQLDIKYKIFIAGNHDTSIYHKLFSNTLLKSYTSKGVYYLEDEGLKIPLSKFGVSTKEHINIYGTPYVKRDGDWAFMKNNIKLKRVWDNIPEDTNILVTHQPPKYILDLTEDRKHRLESAGCSSLMKRVKELKELKLHLFGHIHDNKNIKNSGVLKLSNVETIFSNGSCVKDGQYDKLENNGNVLTYKIKII